MTSAVKVARITALILASLAAACASESPISLATRLDGGQTIADVASGRGLTIIAIFDPAQCFTCDLEVSQLIERARSQHPAPPRVLIVWSRKPTSEEARRLTPMRVRSMGIVSRLSSQGALALLVENGHLIGVLEAKELSKAVEMFNAPLAKKPVERPGERDVR